MVKVLVAQTVKACGAGACGSAQVHGEYLWGELLMLFQEGGRVHLVEEIDDLRTFVDVA